MKFDIPNDEFLNRDHIKGKQAETVSRIVCLLECDVNFGTHLLEQIATIKPISLEQTVGLGMYRIAVETHDAISVLAKEYIDSPSLILARVSFEICLYIQYLTDKKSHERSIHYLQDELINELEACNRTIEDLENIDNITEEYARNAIRACGPYAYETKADIESKLNSDLYKTYYAEYERTKKKNKLRHPPWHSLNNGPRSIYALAEQFGLKHYYTEVYGFKSRLAHGKSALKAFSNGNSEGPGIKRLRTGDDIIFLATTARTMFNISTHKIFSMCLPGRLEEYNDWRIKCRSESDWLSSLVFVEE